jgi:hypothetical protein
VSERDLIVFLNTPYHHCPWYPAEESLDIKDWEHVDRWLRNDLGTIKITHLHIWNLYHLGIQALQKKPTKNRWTNLLLPAANLPTLPP